MALVRDDGEPPYAVAICKHCGRRIQKDFMSSPWMHCDSDKMKDWVDAHRSCFTTEAEP